MSERIKTSFKEETLALYNLTKWKLRWILAILHSFSSQNQ